MGFLLIYEEKLRKSAEVAELTEIWYNNVLKICYERCGEFSYD